MEKVGPDLLAEVHRIVREHLREDDEWCGALEGDLCVLPRDGLLDALPGDLRDVLRPEVPPRNKGIPSAPSGKASKLLSSRVV
jgi:hypothetical protein